MESSKNVLKLQFDHFYYNNNHFPIFKRRLEQHRAQRLQSCSSLPYSIFNSSYQGDSLMFSIAAASIIAKVTRDKIMHDLDKKYPLYGLAKHKVSER